MHGQSAKRWRHGHVMRHCCAASVMPLFVARGAPWRRHGSVRCLGARLVGQRRCRWCPQHYRLQYCVCVCMCALARRGSHEIGEEPMLAFEGPRVWRSAALPISPIPCLSPARIPPFPRSLLVARFLSRFPSSSSLALPSPSCPYSLPSRFAAATPLSQSLPLSICSSAFASFSRPPSLCPSLFSL